MVYGSSQEGSQTRPYDGTENVAQENGAQASEEDAHTFPG